MWNLGKEYSFPKNLIAKNFNFFKVTKTFIGYIDAIENFSTKKFLKCRLDHFGYFCIADCPIEE